MEYRDELADVLRERFGLKKDRVRASRYTAAVSLTHAMADLLSEDDFALFLQAALRADRDSRRRPAPPPPVPRSFTEHFARELRRDLGPLDTTDGRQEAWHIMLALHAILAPDLAGPYIRCAHDAWEAAGSLTRRAPARGWSPSAPMPPMPVRTVPPVRTVRPGPSPVGGGTGAGAPERGFLNGNA